MGEILEEAGTCRGQALLLSYPTGEGRWSRGGRHPLNALSPVPPKYPTEQGGKGGRAVLKGGEGGMGPKSLCTKNGPTRFCQLHISFFPAIFPFVLGGGQGEGSRGGGRGNPSPCRKNKLSTGLGGVSGEGTQNFTKGRQAGRQASPSLGQGSRATKQKLGRGAGAGRVGLRALHIGVALQCHFRSSRARVGDEADVGRVLLRHTQRTRLVLPSADWRGWPGGERAGGAHNRGGPGVRLRERGLWGQF